MNGVARRQSKVVPMARPSSLSFSQNAAQDEADVGRPLAETTHEIREPLAPEGNVHAHAVSARRQAMPAGPA